MKREAHKIVETHVRKNPIVSWSVHHVYNDTGTWDAFDKWPETQWETEREGESSKLGTIFRFERDTLCVRSKHRNQRLLTMLAPAVLDASFALWPLKCMSAWKMKSSMRIICIARGGSLRSRSVERLSWRRSAITGRRWSATRGFGPSIPMSRRSRRRSKRTQGRIASAIFVAGLASWQAESSREVQRAWSPCRLDPHGNRPGIARFPSNACFCPRGVYFKGEISR